MSAIPNMSAPPSGGADFRDVATAHTPFRPGRLVLWIIIVLFATNFAWIVAHNENFGWPVVAQYFFDPTVISGLYISLGLTVVAMAIGTVLGLIIAIARLSNDRLASSFASLFIWFFRGTPLLVQLIFWYNMSTLFPQLSIAVPFGPTLASRHQFGDYADDGRDRRPCSERSRLHGGDHPWWPLVRGSRAGRDG